MNSEKADHNARHHESARHHPLDEQDPRLSGNLGKYICPMHPEVVSDQAGDCPKCGMALELIPTLVPRKGTIYTCPMHPQVQQDHPGECPICGMSLEPKTVDVEDEGEIKSLSLKFWIGLALTIPVLIMAMGNAWMPHSVSKWLQFLLSTPVVVWAGGIFFIRAWRSVVNRSLNMFTLIALAHV